MTNQYISESNKHIEDYFDYYFNDNKKKLNYAILLNGAWGSGKTWFVKKYIEKIQNKHKKVVYISLNGLQNVEQLDSLIYSELYPIVNGKAGKFISKGIGTLLKGFKVDLTGFDFEKFYRIKDSVILFFDDLERSLIDIEELLGHLNNFVENIGIKTIIVADESQINCEEYDRIKEKVIDATFIYTEDTSITIQSIISGIDDSELRSILLNQQLEILRIFDLAGYKNLRSLKQSIYSFEKFYDKSFFTRNSEFNQYVFLKVFVLYLILSIESKKGNFKNGVLNFKSDDEFLMERTIGERIVSKSSGIVDQDSLDFYSKYSLSKHEVIFSIDLWNNILINRIIDKISINKELNENFFRNENKPQLWFELMNFYDLDESKFDELIESAKHDLVNGIFENWGDVLHTFSMLVYFKDIELIDLDLNECENHAINAFSKLCPIENNIKNLNHSDFREHSLGYGFYAKGITFFEEFLDKINEVYIQNYNNSLFLKAEDLLDLMREDPDLFYHRINLTNHKENYFFNVPIFNQLDAKVFAEKLCDLDKARLITVLIGLKKRYQLIYSESIYLKEEKWIKDVFDIINDELYHASNKLIRAKIKQKIIPIFDEIKSTAYRGN